MRENRRKSASRIVSALICSIALLAISATTHSAVVTGMVTNAQTGAPVELATVRVVGTGQSILANADGKYRVLLPIGEYRIKFSHIAYNSKTVTVQTGDTVVRVDIKLEPTTIILPGIRSYDRAIDPAQEIILEAIRRKQELLNQLHDYDYKGYSRLLVAKELEDDSEKVWIIHETQTKSYWSTPDQYKEIIISRRQTANLEPGQVIMSMGEILDFNRDRLNLGRYSIVSPTARDALDHYNYYLLDTIYQDGHAIFRLEIEPQSETDPLFVGTIDIADSSFAVVGVDVSFNKFMETGPMSDLRYHQRYAQFDEKYWMPVEIGFSGRADFGLPLIPKIRFNYIAALFEFQFDTGLEDVEFDEYVLEIAEEADDVDSLTWASSQLIPLTEYENRAYERIDSVANLPKSLTRRILGIGLGSIVLALNNQDIFHFNRVEGAYLGMGITNRSLLADTELRAKFGRALDGHYWEQSYHATYTLNRRRRLRIGGGYHDLITHRPTIVSGANDNATLISVAAKTDPFDYYLEKGFTASVHSKLLNHVDADIEYGDFLQFSTPNSTEYSLFRSDKTHRRNLEITDGKLRTLSGSIVYDSRPRMKIKGRDAILPSIPFTIVKAKLELSTHDVFDSDFSYRKYYVHLSRQQRTFGSGFAIISLYAGSTYGALPPQRHFTIDFGAGLTEGVGVIHTQGETNFVGDRVAFATFEQDFGRQIFMKSGLPVIKDIPVSLILHGGIFWTDFRNEQTSQTDDRHRTASRPYSEVGFGLGHILPLDLKIQFTWQLSKYPTNDFSISIGSEIF